MNSDINIHDGRSSREMLDTRILLQGQNMDGKKEGKNMKGSDKGKVFSPAIAKSFMALKHLYGPSIKIRRGTLHAMLYFIVYLN